MKTQGNFSTRAENVGEIMKAQDMSVRGDAIRPVDNKTLAARAHQVDTEIRNTVDGVKKSITGLGRLLTEMKERQLWHFILDPRTKKGFRTLHDYASYRLGPLGQSKIYDLISVFGLTVGPNPISAEDVDRMGYKKALEFHRLPSKKRTKALIESVIDKPLTQVRQIVQEEINRDLPPEERKEPTIPFVRQYPRALVEKFEALEARALNLEGIRDGDMSISRRTKFMYALLINFEQVYFEELLDADDYAASMETKRRAEDQAAAHAEDDWNRTKDVPPFP
jgi:hypothetical protein